MTDLLNSRLNKLLLVIACAGVMGFAPATEQPRIPRTHSLSVATGAPLAHAAERGGGAPSGAGPLLRLSDAVRVVDGAWGELTVAFISRGGAERTTENAGTGPGEGVSSVAAAWESSEWLELLCGLAFAAFMARRRSHLSAD
jgi:hypothetical protein